MSRRFENVHHVMPVGWITIEFKSRSCAVDVVSVSVEAVDVSRSFVSSPNTISSDKLSGKPQVIVVKKLK
jgi:hypothetical protein